MNTNDSNPEKTLQTKKPTISLPLSHNPLCHSHYHHIYWWMQRGNKNCTSKQTCVNDLGSFHCLCILGVWAKRERERERERERVGFGPLGYEAQVRIRIRIRVRVRDLAIFLKSRVRVWRSAAIKKLSKIFLFIFSIYC